MTEKDAFDLWWEWADKPVDNKPTIDAAIYDAVMALRRRTARPRKGQRGCARRPTAWPTASRGSEDQYGVPKATE